MPAPRSRHYPRIFPLGKEAFNSKGANRHQFSARSGPCNRQGPAVPPATKPCPGFWGSEPDDLPSGGLRRFWAMQSESRPEEYPMTCQCDFCNAYIARGRTEQRLLT